jgi:hypothetical protein
MRTTVPTLLMIVAMLTGCAERRSSSVAYVSRQPSGKYEIRLDATQWSLGGPCNLTAPHKIPESHWIYTDTVQGIVPATNLVLTYERGKTEFPWPQSDLRGSITFSDGQLHIGFERPVCVDGVSVDHYERYPLNGSYKVEVK